MRWVSVVNNHIGPEPLISDCATRRSLWPLQCQPVAMDDEWQISKTLIQSSIQTHGQVSKKSYFDIWHFWKSYCWLRLRYMRTWSSESEPEPEPVHFARSRSRSRSRRTVFSRSRSRSRNASPESEPEPEPTKNVTAPHPWFKWMNSYVYFFVGIFTLLARDNFSNALGADCLLKKKNLVPNYSLLKTIALKMTLKFKIKNMFVFGVPNSTLGRGLREILKGLTQLSIRFELR